ncbi:MULTISPECIES: cysteine hydrolase family protein [Halobacterium]|uniref:cysteine hydrolase family protein n=1 Tax=Halobacterium TaxID=2239 RepID=UPI001966C4C7|nr:MULTISPECIES: isochorismatase family cysteine hydrolase [Halobacterium]MCF2164546.1 cysteine hydrolase [Halobacterium salinarum]MCF2167007.1 cysteine hydrolase [Halobacterium salinarum]MCF2239694.1 cysteine hydrolase [Halobacterium salinarum]MDL0141241.1 cysteine hydrolase [Halobacterium salinarum]QRY22656.1 cysteine hydrolase [Halobacterium sp. GSL-19]
MDVDPAHTAVVVVDMQNGFCHPDGSLHAPASEDALAAVTALVSRARDAGARIVYTRDVHPPGQFERTTHYDEFERWGEHVTAGSWDAQLHDELTVAADDHVVEKHTYDAFYETELDGYLTAHGITELVFCGTLANVCVLHTAGSAGVRDYRPILAADAVGYIEASHKEYTLDHAEWLFGEVADRAAIAFA